MCLKCWVCCFVIAAKRLKRSNHLCMGVSSVLFRLLFLFYFVVGYLSFCFSLVLWDSDGVFLLYLFPSGNTKSQYDRSRRFWSCVDVLLALSNSNCLQTLAVIPK
jgi:hypothetical protein